MGNSESRLASTTYVELPMLAADNGIFATRTSISCSKQSACMQWHLSLRGCLMGALYGSPLGMMRRHLAGLLFPALQLQEPGPASGYEYSEAH